LTEKIQIKNQCKTFYKILSVTSPIICSIHFHCKVVEMKIFFCGSQKDAVDLSC